MSRAFLALDRQKNDVSSNHSARRLLPPGQAAGSVRRLRLLDSVYEDRGWPFLSPTHAPWLAFVGSSVPTTSPG